MINSILFQGNLTRDPEYKDLSSGAKVCNLRIANNRRFTDSNGKQRDETNFIGVQVFGKQATNCHQFLQKGSQIIVQGRLQCREYQNKEGQKRMDVSILADVVQFLDSKKSQSGHPAPEFPAENYRQPQRGYSANDRPAPRPPVQDDDIPW